MRVLLLSMCLLLLSSCGTEGAPYSGVLSVTQFVTPTGATSVFSGSFVQLPFDVLDAQDFAGCTRRDSGACSALTCASTSSIAFVGAGDMTVSVGGSTAFMASAMGTTNTYSATSMSSVFAAGQQVTASAAGGVVPAFTVQATAPALASATAPSTAARTEPLTVGWDGSLAADEVNVALVAGGGSTSTIVSCRHLPTSSGTVTIPGDLVSELPTGAAFVTVTGVNQGAVDSGDYHVVLQVAHGSLVAVTLTD